MLLQSLRALCLAPGGVWEHLEVLRSTGDIDQCLGGLRVASGPLYTLLMYGECMEDMPWMVYSRAVGYIRRSYSRILRIHHRAGIT